MSFSRVWPGGLSMGAKVGSAALVQIDTNISNALDKSTAGDTIAGTILFSGAGCIECQSADDIFTTAVAGITSQIAGGIQSQAAGGIELNGGGSDEIGYGTARTKVRAGPAVPYGGVLSSGWAWSPSDPGLVGPATATYQGIGPFDSHNGATFTNARIFLHVNGPHSALPAVMPSLEVIRLDLTTGAATVVGNTVASAASAAAWDATTYWDCPVTDTVDATQYLYFANLYDESGSNSVVGNIYRGVALTFGGITTAAFP